MKTSCTDTKAVTVYFDDGSIVNGTLARVVNPRDISEDEFEFDEAEIIVDEGTQLVMN